MIPDTAEMLRQLVAAPSVSSTKPELDQSNREVLDLLADWLREVDFEIDIRQLPGKPGKANLIARKGKGTGGLACSGHSDTVPYDEVAWSHDPFDMQQREARVFGLGVCDMKGFFPIVLQAASEFDAKRLRRPFTVIATCDEESTMAGARALEESNERPADAVVIGEPTDLRPIVAHKGFMALTMTARGTGGHSSNPFLGRNALEAVHELMSELMDLRESMRVQLRDDRFEVPCPTMNFGCLHAGDSPNRICEAASLEIDVRLMPGQDPSEVRDAVVARAERAAERTGMVVRVHPLKVHTRPFEGDPSGALARLLEAETGTKASTVAFATEAPFFARLGADVVVIGAGSIDQAHRPDEFLDLRKMEKCGRVLRRLIHAYCVEPKAVRY